MMYIMYMFILICSYLFFSDDLYEEMSPAHEELTYEDMTSPTIDDTYDDIPGQALHNNGM